MQPNFEVLFAVPDHHRLLCLRTRAVGGLMSGTYWTHEQVDQNGVVVARYESHAERDYDGQVQCGWRKYDSLGSLMEEQSFAGGWPVTDRTQPHQAA